MVSLYPLQGRLEQLAAHQTTTLKHLALERINPGLSVLLFSFIHSALEFLFNCTMVNEFNTVDGSAQEKVLQLSTVLNEKKKKGC